MLVRAMEAPRMRHRALLPAFFAAAALLASCSSKNDNPMVTPPVDEHPAPTPMVRVIGTPRVKVLFQGNLTEPPDSLVPNGSFSVVVYDSIGRRTFLNEVRLGGVVMHEEVDGLGSPARYLLDATEIPNLHVGDSLRFEVIDGGIYTPPFAYELLPSYLELPPAGTVVHETQDLVIPWHGAVERVLVTITDIQAKRIRFNFQVENFTGETKLFIPARDLKGLTTGEILVGTDVLDTELIGAGGANLQSLSTETRQNRSWTLAP